MHVFADNMVYFWIVVALVFLLMEMGSPGLFFFISFFCGGVSAAGATCLLSSFIAQTVIFFCGTVLALGVLRYFVVPMLEKNRPHERTNVYALQGKRGFVTKSINVHSSGMVKVQGELWFARSVSGDVIEEGATVEVVDVRGAHVIVKKI